ncbi:hypothetical protein [Rhodoferax sp.]|uniref:hypothetical protein n=1 Tax=Rhodoferax sp. TaxID=50421 RepID=UPI002ACDA213|nr:hypothetical protein [Rhodoferax sp.]MDZ7919482.1 hypothetical protein [Rhodoferax sp.]
MTQVLSYAYFDAAPAVRAAAPVRKTAGSRTLAGMLLAAVLSALLVVAGQVIDTWTDGHLLAGWVALWTVAFAALALLAPPLRKMSSIASRLITASFQAAKERRMEEKMWEYANRDPRIMAELQHAVMRSRNEV